MSKTFTERINGFGVFLRFGTPVLLGLVLFIMNNMQTDIREMRKSFNDMRDSMVYKCDYVEDLKLIRDNLMALEKRTYEHGAKRK